MTLQQAIELRVLNLCRERHITINKLATLSGLTQSTVDGLVNGSSKNPKLLTIVHLCMGLNLSLCEFFDEDFFQDLEDE